jgi:5-oxoprolinase (ATP-hydrolysing) subunit A
MNAIFPRLPRFPAVLLNIDAGEYPDEPEALYGIAQIVSIACGGHAGDDASMDRVLGACARFGTRVGAHPSYADRAGFGRVPLRVPVDLVSRSIADQVGRLAERARAAGQVVAYVKPHGALYHSADRDLELARGLVDACARGAGLRFTLIGPPNGQLSRAAIESGIPFAREGFADRGVRADGTLVPRGEPGALVEDPARARARARELAVSGQVDTVCVHGDTPGAMLIAHAVRQALDALHESGGR